MSIDKVKKGIAVAALIAAASSAGAEVVVVVNPKSSASSLSAEQVAEIFLGKSTTMKPVDLAENSAAREEFYKRVAQKDPAQIKAIWSRIIFTGKGTPPKQLASSDEVKKAIAASPDSIGYIEKSALDASVKAVLTLN